MATGMPGMGMAQAQGWPRQGAASGYQSSPSLTANSRGFGFGGSGFAAPNSFGAGVGTPNSFGAGGPAQSPRLGASSVPNSFPGVRPGAGSPGLGVNQPWRPQATGLIGSQSQIGVPQALMGGTSQFSMGLPGQIPPAPSQALQASSPRLPRDASMASAADSSTTLAPPHEDGRSSAHLRPYGNDTRRVQPNTQQSNGNDQSAGMSSQARTRFSASGAPIAGGASSSSYPASGRVPEGKKAESDNTAWFVGDTAKANLPSSPRYQRRLRKGQPNMLPDSPKKEESRRSGGTVSTTTYGGTSFNNSTSTRRSPSPEEGRATVLRSDPWADLGKVGTRTGWFSETLRNDSPLGERRLHDNSPNVSRSPSPGSYGSMEVSKATKRLAGMETISSRHRRREREAAQARAADRAENTKLVEEMQVAILNGEVTANEGAALASAALEALQQSTGGVSPTPPGYTLSIQNGDGYQPSAHGHLSHIQANSCWREGLRGCSLKHHAGRPTVQVCPSITNRLVSVSDRLERLPGRFLSANSGHLLSPRDLSNLAMLEDSEILGDSILVADDSSTLSGKALYSMTQYPEVSERQLRYTFDSQGIEDHPASSGPHSAVATPRGEAAYALQQQSFLATALGLGEDSAPPAA